VQIKIMCIDVQYQNYLQQVFEDNGTHFDEPNSIITRHQMLHLAFVDLEEKRKNSQEENDKLRDEFTRYKKSQDRMHLGLGVSLIGMLLAHSSLFHSIPSAFSPHSLCT
jgi:hypothetical protein